MSQDTPDRLYNLLPPVYRIRDAKAGEPLRALLAIIGDEAGALEEDIAGLYNNLFIETCDEWVVPYIGDLVSARLLYAIPSAGVSQRSYVANTIAYRRRKGTATVLEQLAYDLSGWQARVVEYFRLLAMTPHLSHASPGCHGIADLRDREALDVLGGPFERTAHTADVRQISTCRGRYNIPDIGIFLWRLKSYPLAGCDAQNAGHNRFTFSPIGLDAPLFNNPRTEREITHIAGEVNLPVPLRRKALAGDLAPFIQSGTTVHVGAGTAVTVSFPVLRATGSITVTSSIPGAQIAIDGAATGRVTPSTFTEIAAGDHPVAVTYPDSSVDHGTVTVTAGAGIAVGFPVTLATGTITVTSGTPGAEISINGRPTGYVTPHRFPGIAPGDYAVGADRDRTREASLYFGEDPVFSVYLNGGTQPVPPERIRICDLGSWDPAAWAEPAFDGNPVDVIVDPVRGRIYTLERVHADTVRVDYSYGFSGDTGGGPYDRRRAIAVLDPRDTSEREWTTPSRDALVPLSFAEAFTAWNLWKDDRNRGIITISDSRTYRGDITVDFAGTDACSLVIQAADEQRPVIDGSLRVRGLHANASLTVSGLLIHGSVVVESGALVRLTLAHCTLTPGGRLGPGGNPVSPHQPSLNFVPGSTGQPEILAVTLDHCITGAISLPADCTTLAANDSIIQSFTTRRDVPVFVSRFAGAFPDEPAESAFIVAFEEQVRGSIAPHDAFSTASVMVQGNRIIVIPAADPAIPDGDISRIQADLSALVQQVPHAPPGTSAFLMTYALVGSPIDSSVVDNPRQMELMMTVRSPHAANPDAIRPGLIIIHADPTGATTIWERLQAAVNAGFQNVFIGCLNGAIVAFRPADQPGMPYEISFDATDGDPDAACELGIAGRPTIAISDDTIRNGPESRLDRTTIFGEVRVRKLDASGVIFNDTVLVEKNQEGCVRFSYVPADSITPRRYRCQPDYAILREDAARSRQPQYYFNTDTALIHAEIRARLVPRYTSVHYRDPGYCQLDGTCAGEIRTGGEDGAEMGAFGFLMQPQREANLRAALDEYLRFGLEAGIFTVT